MLFCLNVFTSKPASSRVRWPRQDSSQGGELLASLAAWCNVVSLCLLFLLHQTNKQKPTLHSTSAYNQAKTSYCFLGTRLHRGAGPGDYALEWLAWATVPVDYPARRMDFLSLRRMELQLVFLIIHEIKYTFLPRQDFISVCTCFPRNGPPLPYRKGPSYYTQMVQANAS